MASEPGNAGNDTRPHTPTRANALKLLSRHQRALLYVGGIVTTLILAAVTIVVIHSQIKDYIAEVFHAAVTAEAPPYPWAAAPSGAGAKEFA